MYIHVNETCVYMHVCTHKHMQKLIRMPCVLYMFHTHDNFNIEFDANLIVPYMYLYVQMYLGVFISTCVHAYTFLHTNRQTNGQT